MKQQRNLLKTLQSVLWAFLGVRATSKAEDDFKAPHPWVYVIIGVVLVALLVLSLALIVRAVAL